MTNTISSTALALLLTYAIHSTVLLSLAWLLARTRRWSPSASELLWKSAMVGAIVTSCAQLYLDVRPAGTVMLDSPPATAATSAVTPAGPATRIVKTKSVVPPQATDVARGQQATPNATRPAIIMSRSSAALFAWGVIALILALSYIARRLILVGRLGDRRDVTD